MLREMKIFLFVIALGCSLISADAYAATKTKKVCVQSDGNIVVKSKCKKGETILSALAVNQLFSSKQGAIGPAGDRGAIGISGEVGISGAVGQVGQQGLQGVPGIKGATGQLDLSTCRITTEGFDSNFFTPSNSVLYAEVLCNPNTEFLLEDDSNVTFFPGSVGSRAALQGRFTFVKNIAGDERDYGVGIYANRFLTVGNGTFQFVVRGVCCPR